MSCWWQRVDTMSSSSVASGLVEALLVGLQNFALTIPELLLILEIIRHLKCHVVVADLFLQSSSPTT